MQEDLDAPARKRSHNLAHDLVAKLTQSILLGQMLPGAKLPSENTIVQEHGVSRTVVREAISKLQASGLVETRHGIGTFVHGACAGAGAATECRYGAGGAQHSGVAHGPGNPGRRAGGHSPQGSAIGANARSARRLSKPAGQQRQLRRSRPAFSSADRRSHRQRVLHRNHAAPGQRHDSANPGQRRRAWRGGLEQARATGQPRTRGDSQRHQAPGPGRGAGGDVAAFDQQSGPVFAD